MIIAIFGSFTPKLTMQDRSMIIAHGMNHDGWAC